MYPYNLLLVTRLTPRDLFVRNFRVASTLTPGTTSPSSTKGHTEPYSTDGLETATDKGAQWSCDVRSTLGGSCPQTKDSHLTPTVT